MDNTTVDLWFRVRGTTLPSLHGYALFASLCREQPSFHGAEWLGVHTLKGHRTGERTIQLQRNPHLGLRMPAEKIPEAIVLSGKNLDVGGHFLAVGVPEIRPLVPASSVSARMVTIKGFEEPESFAEAVGRQLLALDAPGQVEVGPRLVQLIAGKLVVGFAMRLHGLTDATSLRVQQHGIGGRRRMGCGLFRPSQAKPS